MSKRQLIDEIRQFNPTATDEYLDRFDETTLMSYLQRLRDAKSHVIRIGGWRRPGRLLRKAS